MNFQNDRQYVSVAEGFMQKVYFWMCLGLAASAGVAYYVMANPKVMKMISGSIGIMLGLFFAMFGIIIFLSSQLEKLNLIAAAALYTVFTAVEGVLLAPILMMYTQSSVINVFATAALMFVGMAIYGWVTKSDLSSMRNILMMGLWGLFAAGIVNIFLRSPGFSMITSVIAVGIFAMLVAYDIQNLKKLSRSNMLTDADANKYAIMGALGLYLNMLNIFLYLLRLFGDRRD